MMIIFNQVPDTLKNIIKSFANLTSYNTTRGNMGLRHTWEKQCCVCNNGSIHKVVIVTLSKCPFRDRSDLCRLTYNVGPCCSFFYN